MAVKPRPEEPVVLSDEIGLAPALTRAGLAGLPAAIARARRSCRPPLHRVFTANP